MKKDLGFGTEYEKFILKNLFNKIIDEFKIKSIYEYPKTDLLGDTSELFKKIQYSSDSPDLVWNFCQFEQVENQDKLVREMLDISNNYILLIIQNRRNIGILIHRFIHFLLRRPWDHGNIKQMLKKRATKALKKEGLDILKIIPFDVPWFILDVYESGKTIKKFLPTTSKKSIKESFWEKSPNFIKGYLSHHYLILAKK